MRKLFINLLFAALLFVPSLGLAAATVSVDYPGAPGPIFEVTDMAPGQSFTRAVNVTNSSTINQLFKFTVTPDGEMGSLSSQIIVRVVEAQTKVEKYSGTLAALYAAGEISLDVLAPGVPVIYDFVATMSATAGNEYMSLTEKFDMVVGFDAGPTGREATTGGTSVPAGILTSLVTSLGFEPADSGATIGAADDAAVKGAQDSEVKGSEGVTCPWWWIVALVLTVALAFLGGVMRALDESHFVRKYFYLWSPILATIAWISHYYLHGTLQSTWFCSNYWVVMLVFALLGEVAFAWVLRPQGATKAPVK